MAEINIATSNPEQYASFSRFLRRNNVRAYHLHLPDVIEGNMEDKIWIDIEHAKNATVDQTPQRNIISGRTENGNYLLGVSSGLNLELIRSQSVRGYDHTISTYLLKNHTFTLDQLTCRSDYQVLERFRQNGNVSFESMPTEWILGNKLFKYLDHSLYRRLISFNLNERGMFPKVWTLESQKNYWNSSLNGGLPITRKRDEVHEGTFMLHDMFHFVFQDPVITRKETPEEQKAYIAYRMMSEAWTLVLADMLSVDISGLDQTGYNTSARKVYPLLKSMNIDPCDLDNLRSLLYANSVYCLLGDDAVFRSMGAGEAELEDYKAKYGIFFSVDAQWNQKNMANMIAVTDQNPLLKEYAEVLPDDIKRFDTRSLYDKITTPTGQLSLDKLFSIFWDQFMEMSRYSQSANHLEYTKKGMKRYLGGQIHLAFQFPDQDLINQFNDSMRRVTTFSYVDDILGEYDFFMARLNRYIDELTQNDQLLPHENDVYRLGVPHFPPIFLSYNKPKSEYEPLSEVTKKVFGGSLITDGTSVLNIVESETDKLDFYSVTSK